LDPHSNTAKSVTRGYCNTKASLSQYANNAMEKLETNVDLSYSNYPVFIRFQ